MSLIPIIRDNKMIVIESDTGKTIDNISITDIQKESFDNDGKHVIIFKAEIYINIDHVKNAEKFKTKEFEKLRELVNL